MDQVQVGVSSEDNRNIKINKSNTIYRVMLASICHVASFLAQKIEKELRRDDLLIFVIRSTLTPLLRPVVFKRKDLSRALLALDT